MKRASLCVCLAALVAYAVLGCWFVQEKSSEAALAAFANRFVSLAAVDFTCDEGVSASEGDGTLRFEWPQLPHAERLSILSSPIPLQGDGSNAVQLNLYIGGTPNASGFCREKYRVYLEALLLAQGVAGESRRIEVPLESARQRDRLYSLIIPCNGEAYDAVQLRFSVESIAGRIDEGALTCAYLEVIER